MIDHEKQISKAQKAIADERFDEAVKIYDELLTDDCDDLTLFTIYSDLGFLFYEHKRFDDALFYLNSALNIDIEDNMGRINRIIGFIHMQNGQFSEAVDFLEESLQLQEEKTDEYFYCLYELAKAKFELAEFDAAFQAFQLAEPYFKEVNISYYASILYFEGLIRFMQKEVIVANEYFTEIIQHKALEPTQKLNGYFGKMFVANVNKDGDELLELAGKILEIDPKFYDKETLTFFSLKAYQYQSRELEYEHMLDLFMNDYPKGKYSDQYDELINYEFKPLID
jgi:tetratricopeptide (TPR) repeat protein